jgi:ribosomal protein L30
MAKVLLITQKKSESKLTKPQLDTLKALGLRGRSTQVIRKDLRAIRGMLNVLQHIISAEQLEEAEAVSRTTKTKGQNKGYKVA